MSTAVWSGQEKQAYCVTRIIGNDLCPPDVKVILSVNYQLEG